MKDYLSVSTTLLLRYRLLNLLTLAMTELLGSLARIFRGPGVTVERGVVALAEH